MSVLVCSFQGRFGNQVMQYLFCRALAERRGLELRTDSWIGERVFQIEHARPEQRERPRLNEIDLTRYSKTPDFQQHISIPFPEFEFRGYAQIQQCMIYTKRQAQEWLKLRPEIEDACRNAWNDRGDIPFEGLCPIVCHERRGDYAGYGYVLVSRSSYVHALLTYGLTGACLFLSEESPTPRGTLPDDLSFMPDFYRMMHAKTLLRANSSFSWLAALLGNGLVLSPVIDGLVGGQEHHCRFVAGNWPRFANLDFVTDLHVAP